MKIDPALPPPAGLQGSTHAGDEPFRPFEDFLSGAGDASGRAFGFVELGMFGRGQPPQSPAQILPPAGPPLESGNAVVPVESLDAPVDRPAVPSPSPAPAASGIEPGQRPMRVAATPQPRPQAMIDPAATADGIAFLSPEPASADEGASPAVATARRANQTRPPRADVSLIMREKDGAVALIAAGPALDPQACALLRRLARAILARSGLDLAQFHLNGVPLAPDSMIMIGGSHGTRTR